ncbi:threonine synthase [Alphaproteobacteria bacterium]|nr:threonine synthase [Alphaproteobacteria bacterium]
MHYLSTRNDKLQETFTNTLFQGLSKEGGLFLPIEWPKININTLRDKSYEEVALQIMSPFVGGDVKHDKLYEIISSSYNNFRHPKIAPVVNVDTNKYILELFYGPTFSFKDYALQFLGNLFEHLVDSFKRQITVLGATSGDTGSAAIEAFKGKMDIKVFILHPHNKVSDIQRRQMTTVTDTNIFNIAVEGTFDDCQKMVKDLFLDQEIQKKTSLTAINSINWSRIMAQAVYYFWSYLQIEKDTVSFIVPSGNFGNIFSARVAKHMGLPIDTLNIVTNQNDILHRIISQGQMAMNKVKHTISPSMDIQVSSNFERQLFEIYNNNSDSIENVMREFQNNKSYVLNSSITSVLQEIYSSASVSDERTLTTIKLFNDKYNYLADPHTATGLSLLDQYSCDHPLVSLACAHPAKFGSAIEKAIGEPPSFPKELENIFDKEEKMIILEKNTNLIKSHILELL